ncbi:E3 ubiquitin-protein ligase PUB23 [Sesamum indicum]|uniref:U-box domain-containing protein n=1 Tax=Sesamum indicum TaxID=4182 RepID=A0A6I9T2H9_SESIN|nr:E3 ubiquitin-protein ligase PUB23 [Sesamum indicum]
MAEIEVPPYFLCPISLDIMKDPVTVSTGITYDRDSIEEWIFSQRNNTCPVTKQLLVDPELTPNITLRRLIQSWCTLHASHGVERLPTPKAPVSKPQLMKLLKDANSPQKQIKCLETLKSMASQNQTNKRCMEAAGAVEFLASLVVKKALEASRGEDSEFDLSDSRKACDEALSVLYSLQLSESGLKALNNSEFIESLTLVMQSGSYDSRAYSVMLLKSMLEVADPCLLINLRPQFFAELAQILNDQISQKASKATLKVLIIACPWGRNRIKAVESVPVLIDLLLDSYDKRACEMMLTVLDLLCQCAEGRAELLKHGAGLAIVSKKILRVSQAASERAVRILHSVSRFSATPRVLQEMLQIGIVAKLWLVVQVECGSKTKERAREMLKVHARAWRDSPCIPKNLISSYPSS